MIKVGITGQSGFIGSYLFNYLGLFPAKFERVPFDKSFFFEQSKLNDFVAKCDVIVHLAAVNRHPEQDVIYETNISLTDKLINALQAVDSKAHVIFSSSVQENNESAYGRAKRASRQQLIEWSRSAGGCFTGLIIPNIFGPFSRPFHNSVVATFCYQLNNEQTPVINTDAKINLLFVDDLVKKIVNIIDQTIVDHNLEVLPTSEIQVSEILSLVEQYKADYLLNGIFPPISNRFELNLFNTFRSFIPLSEHFPIQYKKHTDVRGIFTEIVKLKDTGGQVSFSITLPQMTRGNHFHTRKIERFSVIKGEARIQLRKVGTDEVINFDLSGVEPAYVDMPVWYTHNITNTGIDELITVFWINEFFNNEDADTFYETV